MDDDMFDVFEGGPSKDTAPKKSKKRQATSYVWKYGWRLYKPEDGLEYWVNTSNRAI